jgi:uncharacterized protein (TIGR03000 family)
MRALFSTSALALCLYAFSGSPQPAQAAPGDAPIIITMTVPANAEVWFNGTKTTQTGAIRRFFSPPVASDRKYSYEVHVVAAGDRKMDVTRPVNVRAGDRINLDFTGDQVRESRGGAGYYDPDAPAVAGTTAVPLAVPVQQLPIERFDTQTNRSFDSNPPQG